MEKKPPVPRAPRHPRPINAPTPDLKNVRSKIGSTDNMKYQPGGGKVGAECPVEGSTKTLRNPGTKMRLRIWIGSDYSEGASSVPSWGRVSDKSNWVYQKSSIRQAEDLRDRF